MVRPPRVDCCCCFSPSGLPPAEPAPLSVNDVVLIRLTRITQMSDVVAIFLEPPALVDAWSRITVLGCTSTGEVVAGATPYVLRQPVESS